MKRKHAEQIYYTYVLCFFACGNVRNNYGNWERIHEVVQKQARSLLCWFHVGNFRKTEPWHGGSHGLARMTEPDPFQMTNRFTTGCLAKPVDTICGWWNWARIRALNSGCEEISTTSRWFLSWFGPSSVSWLAWDWMLKFECILHGSEQGGSRVEEFATPL